jgi:D-amino-acid dehydrogenase
MAKQMTGQRSITVIGAGIVGVCCALHLQREGFNVRLIERGETGKGASFGNAGNFGIASCVPFAMPGILKKLPRMLLDADSPLKLRWGHVPRALPWFVKALAATHNVEHIAAARNSLLSRLREGYRPLLQGAGAGKWVSDSGLLLTWESEAAWQGAAYAMELRRRHGIEMEVLDGDEARRREPALAASIHKAVSIPAVSHALSPLGLTETLAEDFVRRGGEIVRAEVRGFELGPAGPTKILTGDASLEIERVVIAAGVWSRKLAAQLGTSVPLEAERGYHVMFANPGVVLKHPILSADRSIGVTPMAAGIRAAGIAEFAGPDVPANMANARLVERLARQLVPGLKGPISSEWMGPRPSHPDSKPVIGRSPHYANVFFAFGHDHIGLALAGITGQLISELAAGKPTSVDLAPFRADRF